MTTRLIGLNGYARAGKDTAGRFLVEKHGFQRASFADNIRAVALALDPYVKTERIYARLSLVLKHMNWEQAKDIYPDVRRLLQRLGTEAGRNILGDNIWVDTAFRPLDGVIPGQLKAGTRVVFTDMRFPNEAKAIRDRGGETWRINRPGFEAHNAHASETALDDWDFDVIVNNEGTLEDLYERVTYGAFGSAGQ